MFLSEPYRNRGLLGFLWRAIVCHPLTVAREICTVTVWCSIIDVSGIRSLMKAFKHLGSAHSTYHRHGAWAGSSIWQASLRDRPILPRLSPTTSFPNISWDVPSMPDYAHMRSATRADAEWLRSLQIELRRSTISSLRNEDPKLSEIQDWIAAQESGYPLVVATNSKLQPLGYATLSSFLEPERKGCE